MITWLNTAKQKRHRINSAYLFGTTSFFFFVAFVRLHRRSSGKKPDILFSQTSPCFSLLYSSTPRKVTSITDALLLPPLVPRGVVVVQCCRFRFRSLIKEVTFLPKTLIGIKQKIECLSSLWRLSVKGNGRNKTWDKVQANFLLFFFFGDIYFYVDTVCLTCLLLIWEFTCSIFDSYEREK